MREVAANRRAGVVDGALVAGEEDAGAILVPLQVEAVLARLRVVFAELRIPDAEMLGEFQDVAVLELDGGLAAAVGADGAVDLRLDVLGDAAEFELLEAVGFQMLAKTLVFRAFLLAKPADLDQVVNHSFYYRARAEVDMIVAGVGGL